MKVVARLVTRLQGDNDGQMIAVAFSGHNFFKPNTVYEIVDIFGVLTVREVGQSVMAEENEGCVDSPIGLTWASEVGYIMGAAGKHLYLTRDEHAQLMKQTASE